MNCIHARPSVSTRSALTTLSYRATSAVFATLATFATLAATAAARPARAQTLSVRDLPKPAREIDDPFTLVTGAVEVRAGKVVVVDPGEGQLTVVDFTAGTREPLGRQGSGPGEYRSPTAVFRIGGDTLWVLDALQQRIVVFTPDLKAGTTFPFMIFDMQSRTSLTVPFMADRRGNLYASTLPVPQNPNAFSMPDSVDVVRLDPRAAGSRAVIARMRFPTSGKPEMQVAGTAIKFTQPYPGLVAADSWVVFPDGRVGIIRGTTYTVEFIAADGSKSGGARVAWERFPVTDADRTAEMDEVRRQVKDQQQAIRKQLPPNMTMEINVLPPATWPAEYPALSPLAAIPARDGTIWVRRAVPTRIGRERWDVIDASGKLVARWRLPEKHSLVGVGEGAVYTVRTDADDLRYIQRVELPR